MIEEIVSTTTVMLLCGIHRSRAFYPTQAERSDMTDGEDAADVSDIRMPDDSEVFAEVTNMLGANRVTVRCADGVERTARIPGKMQKRIWIREGDIVLVEPWDWQDEKADITWRYEQAEAETLRENGYIHESGAA